MRLLETPFRAALENGNTQDKGFWTELDSFLTKNVNAHMYSLLFFSYWPQPCVKRYKKIQAQKKACQ